ncbi:MAG: FAD-dependent monooxygenase [Alphaproteobacteria bacterium]
MPRATDTPARSSPILVVGAGPVGLAAAWALARHGASVRIVDRSRERSDTSRALVLWSRTLELLDALDPAGGAAPFVAAGWRVAGATVRAVGHEGDLARIEFDRIESRFRFATILPQSDIERMLEERCASLSVPVERGVEMIGLEPGDEIVQVRLRGPDGVVETVRTPWLVACDGAHGSVRHALGLPFPGEQEPHDWWLADVKITGGVEPDRATLFLHPAGLLGLFPIRPPLFRVVAVVGRAESAEKPVDPRFDEIRLLVAERGGAGLRVSEPSWLSGFRVQERLVENYRPARRVFLAGDAAHVHSPAGGQGMNTGIQDACNLAWKLALVARGDGRENPLLDSYDGERRAVGEEAIEHSGVLTRMANLPGAIGRSIRDQVVSIVGGLVPIQSRAVEMLAGTGIAYPDSPISGEYRGAMAWLMGGVESGSRMPDATLVELADGPSEPARVPFVDLLRSGRHLLLLFTAELPGDDVIDHLDGIATSILGRFEGLVDAFLVTPSPLDDGAPRTLIAPSPTARRLGDPSGLLHLAVGAGAPTLLLVRPDGHLGFRAQPADREPLLAHLDRCLVARG